jgi:hypothetical protein
MVWLGDCRNAERPCSGGRWCEWECWMRQGKVEAGRQREDALARGEGIRQHRRRGTGTGTGTIRALAPAPAAATAPAPRDLQVPDDPPAHYFPSFRWISCRSPIADRRSPPAA